MMFHENMAISVMLKKTNKNNQNNNKEMNDEING